MFDNEDDDYDSSTSDSNGGIYSGPIGQQIGQQIGSGSSGGVASGSGTWSTSTSTGNGSTVTSTGNGYQVKSAYAPASSPPTTWRAGVATMAQAKPFTKTKVRYVIVDKHDLTLELKEKDQITPQEMIGLSKFIALVSTYTTLILGQAVMSYNFNIKWSEIIADLGIQQHFVPGKALSQYDNDNSEVLDILLFDPS